MHDIVDRYRTEYVQKAAEYECRNECWDVDERATGPHTHVFFCPAGCERALAYNPDMGYALHPWGHEESLMWMNITERDICWYCYESESEHGSTLVRFTPEGENDVIRFGDEMARDNQHGDDPPSWFWNVFTRRDYRSTDAWRGHYDTKLNGLVTVTEGWVTGYPDESVRHKLTASDLYEKLQNGDVTPPVNVYWLFEPTSNIFSMASEILVAEEDHDAVMEWLGEDFDALDRAFG